MVTVVACGSVVTVKLRSALLMVYVTPDAVSGYAAPLPTSWPLSVSIW